MQKLIRSLVSSPQEHNESLYQKILVELRRKPCIWTVLHINGCDVGRGKARVPIPTSKTTGAKFIRLFSEYRYAVEFCETNPGYHYEGIPLIAQLQKGEATIRFYTRLQQMGVNRVKLDDAAHAQVLNFQLTDLINVNEIHVPEPESDIDMQAPELWIDMLSQEMLTEFIDPIIHEYFSNDPTNVKAYIKNNAPIPFILYICFRFQSMLDSKEWRAKNRAAVNDATDIIYFTKRAIINRLTKRTNHTDRANVLMLSEPTQLLLFEQNTTGFAVSDFGLSAYIQALETAYNRKLELYDIASGQLDTFLYSLLERGIQQVSLYLPANDRIRISISITDFLPEISQERSDA